MKITPLGEPIGGEVRGGQGLRGRAVTPVDHDRAAAGGESRRPWSPLVGVGEGPEQGRSERSGVAVPSMPVISVPLELVSGASSDGDAVRRAGWSTWWSRRRGRDDDAQGVGQARGGLLGVGVAAEHLEDRLAGSWRRERRDADLLDHERDARGGRRAVAPAADGRVASRRRPWPACWGR